MRRLLNFFGILLVLLVSLGVLLKLYHLRVVETMAIVALRSTFANSADIRLSSINKNQLTLSSASITTEANGTSLNLEVIGLDWHFDLDKLRSSFVYGTVEVNKIILQLRSSEPGKIPPDASSSQQLSVHEFLRFIPELKIHIKELVIEAPEVLTSRLKLELSYSALGDKPKLDLAAKEMDKLSGIGKWALGGMSISGSPKIEVRTIKNDLLRVSISGLDAELNGLAAENLEANLEFDQILPPRMSKPAVITSPSISGPLPFKGNRAALLLKNIGSPETSLSLEHLQTQALGAGIVLGSLRLYPWPERATFAVIIKGLSLERVLELYPQDGISGSGTIDAVLPVHLKHGKLSISSGHLAAREPGGVIRLSSDELDNAQGSMQKSLKIPYEALKNYHYSSLSSSIDYTPEGTLTLGLTLKGRNPDYRGGQSVNFNISLEDNIPSLLKSIEAFRGFEDSFDFARVGS